MFSPHCTRPLAFLIRIFDIFRFQLLSQNNDKKSKPVCGQEKNFIFLPNGSRNINFVLNLQSNSNNYLSKRPGLTGNFRSKSPGGSPDSYRDGRLAEKVAVPIAIGMAKRQKAQVAELVDAPDSKSGSARSVGSIPTLGTKKGSQIDFLFYLYMATVYILHSIQADKYYIGSCHHFEERFEQHQLKIFVNSFTSKINDWQLHFRMDDLDYQQARKIENHIKSMKSRKYIENLTKYPEISEKLKIKYQ